MKKTLLICLILCVVLALTLAIVACVGPDAQPPVDGDSGDGGGSTTPVVDVPQNIEVTDIGAITWKSIYGCTYELEINGVVVPVAKNRYNLADFSTYPTDGVFEFRVRKVDEQGQVGTWSEMKSVTIRGRVINAIALSSVEGFTFTWRNNANASGVEVKVNGTSYSLPKGTTTYTMDAPTQDTTISIIFKGDGVFHLDSEPSTFVYSVESKSYRLDTPKNIYVEEQTVYFDHVVGANYYHLYDYTGHRRTIKVNHFDMETALLVRYIQADADSDVFSASEMVEVSYFGEEGGKGTEEDPYLISTTDQFRYIEHYEAAGISAHYALVADMRFASIAFSEEGETGANFYRMGSFSGHLDGRGHKLTNFKGAYKDGYFTLFSTIHSTGIIENIVIAEANLQTWTEKTADGILHEKGGNVALFAHINRGTIRNITVTASKFIASHDGAAALVNINQGNIENCTVDSKSVISGHSEAGAICIYNEGRVTGCVNHASVSGNGSIGGIVGRNAGYVARCTNYGAVAGSMRVGGIVGYNYNVSLAGVYEYATEVRYCANHGTVTGGVKVGGIAGQNGTDGAEEMGAYAPASAAIYYCYNTAEISGQIAGGLVGDNYATKGANPYRGVVSSFSIGSVSGDITPAEGKIRIFVDTTEYDWITADGGKLYCYYWGGKASTTWPGDPMTRITYQGGTYWYIDIDATCQNVIFSRCGYGGIVYNQSVDIPVAAGTYLYHLVDKKDGEGKWTGGSWSSSATLEANVAPIVGALAGYSQALYDCYYLSDGTQVGHADAMRNNLLYKNGQTVAADALALTSEQIKTAAFVQQLNTLFGSNVFVAGTDYPVFIWE